MNKNKSYSCYFKDRYSLFISISILIALAGMLHVALTFAFFSDEVHLFVDSLWSVDYSLSGHVPNIESIYSDYLIEHYPDRGGHPNGIALFMGAVMWMLSFIKEVNMGNIHFFVLAIRLLMILIFLLSLLFVYLFFKEIDEINGKMIGKIAVILSAISPPLISYGSIRAMDTVSLLFMMISIWLFARLLKSSNPSLLTWVLPGIGAGIFLTLKISGPLIILVLAIYSIILAGNLSWKEVSKRMITTCLIALFIVIVTNNPYLYAKVLFSPSSAEHHSITSSDDIRRFGFIGFQITKLWEYLHPDYYHYLGYHRHGGPNIPILGLINKFVTPSFLYLYVVSFLVLLAFRKWKEILLFNAPFILLFLSLPNLQIYRFLPVFPLWLATIAFALILTWSRSSKILYKFAVAAVIAILMFILPAYSYFDHPDVDKETYLDLGDVAARNNHMNFERGIFYDRDLRNYRAYQLGVPFSLMPKKDGIIREMLTFQEPGQYFIDFLIGAMVRDDEFMVEMRTVLNDTEHIIRPKDNDKKWFRTGPFSIYPDNLEEELLISINGIKYDLKRGSLIGIYDIRIVKYDNSTINDKAPVPWWLENTLH